MAKTEPHKPFDDMSRRIVTNGSEFSGAFVIVAPDGVEISFALIGPVADAATFYSVLKTKVDIACAEFQMNDQAGPGGFPIHRR